jgi:hypothetical protein
MIISTWAENDSSSTPTTEELAAFADQYGHTFPVVADAGWAINNRYEQDFGIPTQVLLAPGAELVVVDEMVSESQIEEILPE